MNRFTEQLRRYALAAVAGGVLLFLVEAFDRVVVLWPSLLSIGDLVRFVVALSPTLLIGTTAGALIGAVLLVSGGLRTVSEDLVRRYRETWSVAGGAAIAILVLALIGWMTATLAPELVDVPLQKLVNKIDDRIVHIPFVVSNFKALLVAAFVVAGAKLVAMDALVGTESRRARRWIGGALAVLTLVVLVGIYAVDSRIFFGRYELSMHLPALAAMAGCSFGGVTFGLGVFETGRARRWLGVAAIVIVGLSTAGFAAALWTDTGNANVKALIWRRSIIARRAYQTVAMLTDRDRDGFSGFLEGDTDDHDPRVNPVATDVPGDGIDQNCIGGDAAARPSDDVGMTPAVAPGSAKNFILISIDTLRADRMSIYGYGRPTTPRLEEIGSRGVVFERAYSQGSNTGQSFASMQRSSTRAAIFSPGAPTLFQRMLDAGMRTTFINARRDDAWLETKRWLKYRSIILTGISTYDHREGESLWDADGVTDRAIEYLASLPAGTRHATWIHYLDPHEPRKKMPPNDWGNAASDKYDTEVAYADLHIGRLFDYLRDSGALENSVVMLVSDHGEAFLDHGMDLHGNRPYNDQLHVPLMMWAPDVPARRESEPVGVLDLAPSVLSYLGLDALPNSEGRDIFRSTVVARPLHHETPLNLVEVSFFSYAVTVGDWKYILDVRGNTVELYDLASDPGEIRNLVDVRPDTAAEMRAALAEWLDSTESVFSLRAL